MSSFNQMLLQWLIVAMLIHSSPSILVLISKIMSYHPKTKDSPVCTLYIALSQKKACAIVNY